MEVLQTEPAMGDPVAWISYNVLTGKEWIDRKPLQSLQPGVYKHTPLYAAPSVTAEKAYDPDVALCPACFLEVAKLKPLSDSQIEDIWRTVKYDDLYPLLPGFNDTLRLRFARAIIAHMKGEPSC